MGNNSTSCASITTTSTNTQDSNDVESECGFSFIEGPCSVVNICNPTASAFETFANDLDSIFQDAVNDNTILAACLVCKQSGIAQSAVQASGALASQVASEAATESENETQTPIQQFYKPLLIGGVVLVILAYIVYNGKGK